MTERRGGDFPDKGVEGWRDVLGRDDKVLKRLEMVYLFGRVWRPRRSHGGCTWT